MAFDSDSYHRTLEVLNIDDLEIDETYQRPLSQAHVERILKDLDSAAADAITVSHRKNGKFYIVNGQHIASALKISGETEILAFVYTGLTGKQEAALRLKKNNNRADTSMERYYAELAAQDPVAIGVRDVLAEFGTQINKSPSKYSGFNTVSALEALYREDEGILLRQTVRMIKDAFEEIGGNAATAAVVKGVAWFIKVHVREYQRKSLIERLHLVGVEELHRRGRNHKAISGGADWLNFYRAMVESYNHRRAAHTRLEVKTRNWGLEEKSSKSQGRGNKAY